MKSLFPGNKKLASRRARRSLPSPMQKPQRRLPAARVSLSQMIEDLHNYKAELDIQNQALRYSQSAAEGASERFLTLFSSVPLAVMVVDERGMVLESNATALRLLRPQESDRPLNFLLPLISTEHITRVQQTLASAKASGSQETSEVVFRCGANAFFTGDLHVARIENNADELAHFICAIIDQSPLLAQRQALQISTQELQKRNQELQQSQNRLASIINSSLDVIICVDGAQRITIFNPSAERLFECPAKQAVGSPVERFLPGISHRLPANPTVSHVQLGEVTGLKTGGDDVALDVSVSFEHQTEGETITFFAHDLTRHKGMEAHRQALEAQLRESQKMQAIGTMAGGIAHDFNNIISAILGNVELAREDIALKSPAFVSLGEIDKAARRARNLVRQILTFSRNETPKLGLIQLADVVREAVHLIKVGLPPLVELTLQIDPQTPAVLADATQIEQALLNLCVNAIHAIGEQRGAISIELGYKLGDQPERRGGARGHHVRLVVRDTGCGIEPETQLHVFEPFFTTKQVGQGTGLGLAVVHGIMRTHQGSVDVTSAPGCGSVFTLYFPVPDASVAAVTTSNRPAVSPSAAQGSTQTVADQGGGRHVMYVDDDSALVFLVERVLKRKGFRVTAFTDPHLAAEALRANAQAFDLLVTDYNMPGYCGIELLQEAQRIRSDLPVALTSGYITAEIEHSALQAGASALIYKPNDVTELAQTLLQLLVPKVADAAAPSSP